MRVFETRCDIDGISKDGKISKPLIAAKSENLMGAIENGAKACYFPGKFEVKYPDQVECIIAADNIPLQAAVKDTTVDRLTNMHKLALVHRLSDGSADWAKVELTMRRSDIDRTHETAHLKNWLVSSAGGVKDPWVLNGITRIARALKVMRETPCLRVGEV